MKILVAGKGFIGENLGEKLRENHEVFYLDRSEADFNQDITESFEIKEEFDVLIHTVGLAPGFNSAKEYQRVHLKGTENLLNGIKADKVIYISALKAGEVEHSFFRTKKKAENKVKKSGKDYTIIRSSTVYGDGNKLLEVIGRMAFTRIFPDIKTRTQPIRISDLAEIISKSLENHESEIIKAAGPEKMTLGRLGKIIYNKKGFNCVLIPYPQFLLEAKLLGLSFLPPPFQRENIEILRTDNITEENDADEIINLEKIS